MSVSYTHLEVDKRQPTGSHLQANAAKRRTVHFYHAFEFEFKPDQKQHQDDTELGEVQRRLHFADQLQAPGADQPAGDRLSLIHI